MNRRYGPEAEVRALQELRSTFSLPRSTLREVDRLSVANCERGGRCSSELVLRCEAIIMGAVSLPRNNDNSGDTPCRITNPTIPMRLGYRDVRCLRGPQASVPWHSPPLRRRGRPSWIQIFATYRLTATVRFPSEFGRV